MPMLELQVTPGEVRAVGAGSSTAHRDVHDLTAILGSHRQAT